MLVLPIGFDHVGEFQRPPDGVEFHQSTTTTRPRAHRMFHKLVSASDLFERNSFANLEPRPSRFKGGVQPLCTVRILDPQS